MIWNTAAGIIIGGGVLVLIVGGLVGAERYNTDDGITAAGCGSLIVSLIGFAIAVWVVFFKAHF